MINSRLSRLRPLMTKRQISAVIIPSSDPHQSEYFAERWTYLNWISGFTGSAGTVAITDNHAGLWTDSRYFLQAEDELSSSEFELHRLVNQFANAHTTWLQRTLPSGSTVGIDGWMFSEAQVRSIKSILAIKDIDLNINCAFLDEIWTDQPELSSEAVFKHEEKYAGKTSSKKIDHIRTEMSKKYVQHHLVTTLDDIAWILNIRGRDVVYNPVFISYLLISENQTVLYIDKSKLTPEIAEYLRTSDVMVKEYSEIEAELNQLPEGDKILVDPNQCNHMLYRAINCEKIDGATISRLAKAIKNDIEIGHIRTSQIKDGVALTKFYCWLNAELEKRAISEYDIGLKIAEFRSQQPNYFGESFSAIVGYGANGALNHYRADEKTCAQVAKSEMLLIDSGGQYLDGTTDITRTIHTGTPTAVQIKSYTLVLKGHIALAQAIFPKGTSGGQLDILARKALWDAGQNYLHGTGHGVGFFMNVHEAPQGFAAGPSSRSNTRLDVGMLISNEPGYYEDHEYGIRIENLVVVKESNMEGFLDFETVTMFPISTRLVDKSLMTASEVAWLNSYHEEVLLKLSPDLSDAEREWMEQMCAAI